MGWHFAGLHRRKFVAALPAGALPSTIVCASEQTSVSRGLKIKWKHGGSR
jgi:hypothetical protein